MTTTDAYRIPNSAEKATGLLHWRRLPGWDGALIAAVAWAALAQHPFADGTASFPREPAKILFTG